MNDGLQQIIQHRLDAMIADGQTGLQFCAYHRGHCVVDCAAGDGVTPASLIPVFSTGKGIASTIVHQLVEQGLLSYDEPVATWWPEFAAKGKAAITLREILDHSAGLAMLPEHGGPADIIDWDRMCTWLADQTPDPAPGSEHHYHAITFGWLVGEVVRRASGITIAEHLARDIVAPLGLDGCYFGVPAERLSEVLAVEKRPEDSEAAMASVPNEEPDDAAAERRARIAARAIPEWVKPLEDWINRDDIRSACLPASSGIANAHSLAHIYATLVGEGADGIRLLKDATLDEATRYQPRTPDARHRFALGYICSGPDDDPSRIFGHGGYGGSLAVADRQDELAIGFTTKRMGCSCGELIELLRAELGCPLDGA